MTAPPTDPPAPRPGAYRHPEAFALMRYQCDSCASIEVLWNSRDGVTPFVIRCAQAIHQPDGTLGPCGGSASHIDWNLDERRPDHVPAPGSRYFRDATLDDLRALYQRRKDAGQFPPTFSVELEASRAMTEHGEPPPWLETVPAA